MSLHELVVVWPGVVAKFVERWSCMLGDGELCFPDQVKPMTYKIDTCRFLAWQWELINAIGQGLAISGSGLCDGVGYWIMVAAAGFASWAAV